MKASVDRSGCIGCGLCASVCESVFEMDDEGLAKVIVDVVPSEAESLAEEARDCCPVSVIDLE